MKKTFKKHWKKVRYAVLKKRLGAKYCNTFQQK